MSTAPRWSLTSASSVRDTMKPPDRRPTRGRAPADILQSVDRFVLIMLLLLRASAFQCATRPSTDSWRTNVARVPAVAMDLTPEPELDEAMKAMQEVIQDMGDQRTLGANICRFVCPAVWCARTARRRGELLGAYEPLALLTAGRRP